MRHALYPLAILVPFALAAPAMASTLPEADFTYGQRVLGLGIGQGISGSVDVPISRQVSLGGAIGIPAFALSEFDVRGLYKFVDGGRKGFTLDGILGVLGATALYPGAPPANLEVGIGMAYPFTDKIIGRVNLVIVPFLFGNNGNAGFVANPAFYNGIFAGPSGGLEVAYRFTPRLEGTLGENGLGNLLGLKYAF